MDDRWGVGVSDSAIIMLAGLICKRMNLRGMKVNTRQSAIAAIKGLYAVSKRTPLAHVVQSAIGKKAAPQSRCSACGKPLLIGELCRTIWRMNDGEHIQCTGSVK